MDSKQIGTIVAISFVVAVLSSVMTLGITGNSIWDRYSTNQVVNAHKCMADQTCEMNNAIATGEISAQNVIANGKILSNKATYTGVAEMLGDAESSGTILLGISSNENGPIMVTNGHTTCGPNRKCLLGFSGIVHPNTQYYNYDTEGIMPCDTTLDLNVIQASSDWVAGSTVLVQYLCIDNELLEWADAGFPGG